MKKRFSKLVSLFLTGAMVATALVGCGNNAQTESAAGKETESAVESATPEPTEEPEFSYPLEGNRTISISAYAQPAFTANEDYETFADTEWGKATEKATGIKAEYLHQSGNSDEWFNFMIADGDYPDVMQWNWQNYPGGAAGAYADGVALELNDIIDQYMPNFKAYMEAHPEIARLVKTDEGKYYAIPNVMSSSMMGGTSGIYFRQDILDDLGGKVPTTMDEWHDLLVQVKDKYNMVFAPAGTNFLMKGSWANAYVAQSEYQVNPETGKVEYTYTTDAFREYLTVIAQWYKEGLIDTDFAAMGSDTVKAKLLNNEAFGSWGWAGSHVQGYMISAWETNPDFMLAGALPTKKDASSKVIHNSAGAQASFSASAVITTKCEDVEAAARYLDYFWSEEGILLTNFGIEGESYTMVDGVPTYTDVILNNPDGLNMTTAMGRYIRSHSAHCGVQDEYYLRGYYQYDNVEECLERWGGEGTNQYALNTGLSFTDKETEALAAISTEISSYSKEMMTKFVLGEADIEKDWDAYVAAMEKLKVADAVAVYQAAYERFIAR